MATTGNSGQDKGSSAKPAPKKPAAPRASAKVFRRRRLVVAILALLVIAGLTAGGFYAASLLGAGAEDVVGTDPGAGKPEGKVGTPPSAVCDEAKILVTAAVDKPSYGPEEQPVLTLQVKNSGQAPCDINVGTSQMEYQITSGDDIIYNSKNCQLDPVDLVKNLAPGESESANMVWKVNRNAPDCAKVVSAPGRGGATYTLVATLGKWSSEKVTFTLE